MRDTVLTGRKPNPNAKLVGNLLSLLTEHIHAEAEAEAEAEGKERKTEVRATVNSSVATTTGERQSRGGGEERKPPPDHHHQEAVIKQTRTAARGAEFTLQSLGSLFGDALFSALPQLSERLTQYFSPSSVKVEEEEKDGGKKSPLLQSVAGLESLVDANIAEDLLTSVRVVSTLLPFVSASLRPRFLSFLPALFVCLRHPHERVRTTVASCLTIYTRVLSSPTLEAVVYHVVPSLSHPTHEIARWGAAVCVQSILEERSLELVVVPYLVFLVLPLLARMSDTFPPIRATASRAFATAVKLVPLERGVPSPPDMDARLALVGVCV